MYLNEEMCYVCKKVTTHHDGKCCLCFEKAEKKRIRTWEAKSTKAKLSDLRKRIEELERGPARY